MKTAKVLRVKTEAPAHVVIRKGAGKKLFDMYIHGVIIAIAVPKDAEIQVDPRTDKGGQN